MTTQPPQPPDPWGQHPQHPQQPYQPRPPATPPRSKPRTGMIILGILGGFALFFGGCLFGAAITSTSTTGGGAAPAAVDQTTEATAKPSGGAAETTKAPATTKPKPAAATIGEGTFEVGSEVKPGTYVTTVPDDSNGCYWARLRGFGGSEIIDNDISSAGQRARVTIRASDKGFETNGCGIWTRTS